MKHLLPLVLLAAASPAAAHSGPHLHPHGVEGWMVGLGILAMIGAVLFAVGRRK